jgi:hypothetical protein
MFPMMDAHLESSEVAFDDLFAPPDVETAALKFEANCGPAAFAALYHETVCGIMRRFPQYPEKPWTNRTQMKTALNEAGASWEQIGNRLPSHGLCLIEFCGPWTTLGYRLARLRYTHWIAVSHGYLYDINWNGWLPVKNWEEVVAEELIQSHPLCNGWAVMTSFEIKKPIASILSCAVKLHCSTFSKSSCEEESLLVMGA